MGDDGKNRPIRNFYNGIRDSYLESPPNFVEEALDNQCFGGADPGGT